ncbi:hypothetical protein TBLA_0E04970 [Henningerozyma blattae CBS 6284]|uniref:non-specific serine/threonine protein kinase n=1 Tax=Henningerozyma blattae (strain ATCC 34711 / CBS 6284 / DSM 70876 / NBRC 10599 / NRRL Y-10934 / UCD 77-7) TaxID=1071380 RepID=I2H594_HENB6|nr:hypothetical protein TBLA_0E04970 [Tetrapisispora blattae CBS 6284]CCH61546.1 hypothetical protein TBLA_0E04970 [Tetrapisispora blattae CBS 6284]
MENSKAKKSTPPIHNKNHSLTNSIVDECQSSANTKILHRRHTYSTRNISRSLQNLNPKNNVLEDFQTIYHNWNYEKTFNIKSLNLNMIVFIYDSYNNNSFLGYLPIQYKFQNQKMFYEKKWCYLQNTDVISYSSNGVDTTTDLISGTKSNPIEIEIELKFTSFLDGYDEDMATIAQHNNKIQLKNSSLEIGNKIYSMSDFVILKLIGTGTFGKVFSIRKKSSNHVFAMKIISKKLILNENELRHVKDERNILLKNSIGECPFVVQLKYAFQNKNDLFLITNYFPGGELYWYLRKYKSFPEKWIRFYVGQLSIALDFLHKNGVIYRDLKPENVLLDSTGNIALCDFGLSKLNTDNNSDFRAHTFCGTTDYLAPEVILDDNGYSYMVDYWSLGVLTFELFFGISPFYSELPKKTYAKILYSKITLPKYSISFEGRIFLKALLRRKPQFRLGNNGGLEEIKRSQFFRGFNWDALICRKMKPPIKPQTCWSTEFIADTQKYSPSFMDKEKRNIYRVLRIKYIVNRMSKASLQVSVTTGTIYYILMEDF